MSLEGVLEAPVTVPDPQAADGKATYKSWKKKYRKMKLVFDQKMRESDQLFRDEQRAQDAVRRLAEENDRLLELLLDVNDSAQIPLQHRYDLLSKPPPSSAVPGLEPDDSSNSSAASSLPKPFSNLLTVPHSDLSSVPEKVLPPDIAASPPPAMYLSPSQEDDYLFALDNSLGSSSPLSHVGHTHSNNKHSIANTDREKDKDLALRNPVSVYNWLRRHQPQVFLQDNEGAPEKTGAKSSRGAGKRASVAAKSTSDPVEFIDEDGMTYGNVEVSGGGGGGGGGRGGRRKKDDDGVYRPKGGGTKLGKRKRDLDAAAGAGGGRKARKVYGSSAGTAS
ncbi:MAG: hypothetical protein M1833_005150 [Piccolia ochrophora]|nr:MAG: hypothetical protein M1833_005150 [Piccolia ochrophora]